MRKRRTRTQFVRHSKSSALATNSLGGVDVGVAVGSRRRHPAIELCTPLSSSLTWMLPLALVSKSAQLANGARSDTLTTAADGTAGAVLGAASGQTPPDTAIVEVRAEGLRGGAVPGSGQRFIVLFQ